MIRTKKVPSSQHDVVCAVLACSDWQQSDVSARDVIQNFFLGGGQIDHWSYRGIMESDILRIVYGPVNAKVKNC